MSVPEFHNVGRRTLAYVHQPATPGLFGHDSTTPFRRKAPTPFPSSFDPEILDQYAVDNLNSEGVQLCGDTCENGCELRSDLYGRMCMYKYEVV